MFKAIKKFKNDLKVKEEEMTEKFENEVVDIFKYLESNFLKLTKEQLRIMEWDESMIQVMKTIEKHSKCSAKKVCCLIVSDNNKGYNILSIGLNGTPSGQTNCCDKWKRKENGWLDLETKEICGEDAHRNWSLQNEIHAETNALAKCNQTGISTQGAIAFISYSPCFNCSKMLVSFGIKKIVFAEKYDDFDTSVREFLCKNNVEVIHLYKNEKGEFTRNKLC